MPPEKPQPHAPQNEPAGPIVGTIIIIILLLIGGYYFWNARLNQRGSEQQLPFTPSGAPANQ